MGSARQRMKARSINAEDLSALPLLAGLSSTARQKLIADGRICCYKPSEFIAFEGDPIDEALLLLKGGVVVSRVSMDGREQILERLERGALINLTALLTQNYPCFTAQVRASGQTEILKFPIALFWQFIRTEPRFTQELLCHLAGRDAALLELAASLSLSDVRCRLAACLIRHAGSNAGPGFTQAEIAAEIGTVREVVARLLREFEDQGWLIRVHHEIRLRDRLALEALAGGSHWGA